jgi:hypothetical protein
MALILIYVCGLGEMIWQQKERSYGKTGQPSLILQTLPNGAQENQPTNILENIVFNYTMKMANGIGMMIGVFLNCPAYVI